MAVLGVPLYLTALWAGLYWGGSERPTLGVLSLLVVSYALVLLLEAVDPPLSAWPMVVAALAGGYVLLEGRVVHG